MITPKELRAKWVAALRSGRYKQGVSYLRWKDALCCLGVLCEIAIEEGVPVHKQLMPDGSVLYDGQSSCLPVSVSHAAGLRTTSGHLRFQGAGPSLVSINDSGTPFAKIADIIESEPERLFVDTP